MSLPKLVKKGWCNFCGKEVSQVKRMILGVDNARICNECFDLCWDRAAQIVRRAAKRAKRKAMRAADPMRRKRLS